ncbi:MAG TPA: hypothetical protein VFU05_07720 [Cyclobacteriaceae bacterium]|nr:hypothetical protein [Cyclobacteriaceae bacterium]
MKTLLIILGIAVVCALAFRLIYIKMNGGSTERQWYVSHLHYDFSMRVDSVKMLHGDVGLGKVSCTVTRGNPSPTVEDSLNHHLTHHDWLQFLVPGSGNQRELILMRAELLMPGDSISVNSSTDFVQVFRNRKLQYENELSTTLEARGNPFTY